MYVCDTVVIAVRFILIIFISQIFLFLILKISASFTSYINTLPPVIWVNVIHS